MCRQHIAVSEIFGPTIQGEGPLMGHPTIFVRTGGCESRCIWCDSMFAVDPQYSDEWEDMSSDDVLDRILALSMGYPMLVTLSGGNPALQPLADLIAAGHAMDYTFALETQGTLSREWFTQLDHLVLSPKPPSSGMTFSDERFQKCLSMAAAGQVNMAIKVVIFDETDYQFARVLYAKYRSQASFFLQAGTDPQDRLTLSEAEPIHLHRERIFSRMEWLMSRAAADHWNEVRVLPQLHSLIWGDKRGV